MKSNLLLLTHESAEPHSLEVMWGSLEERGWLRESGRRVVIHIDGEWHEELVRATADSLQRFVSGRWPQVQVEIVPAWRPGISQASESLRPDGWRVTSPVMPEGVAIPQVYVSPAWLVTIAGAGPDPAARISSVLRAQVRMLTRLGVRGSPAALVYEAHRLCRSDVSIACGTITAGTTTESHWWVASPDDIAVESAVARAAGTDPAKLPYVRYVMRHETPAALHRQAVCALPRLENYLAPRWKSGIVRAWADLSSVPARIMSRVRLVGTVFQRLKGFARRRFAGNRPAWMRTT